MFSEQSLRDGQSLEEIMADFNSETPDMPALLSQLFILSARTGRLDVMRKLFKRFAPQKQELIQSHKFHPFAENFYPFIEAAKEGHLAIVRELLKEIDPQQKEAMIAQGFAWKATEFAALHFAVENRHLDVIGEILTQADLAQQEKMVTPQLLSNALKTKDVALVFELLRHLHEPQKSEKFLEAFNSSPIRFPTRDWDMMLMILREMPDGETKQEMLAEGFSAAVAAGHRHLTLTLLKEAHPAQKEIMVRDIFYRHVANPNFVLIPEILDVVANPKVKKIMEDDHEFLSAVRKGDRSSVVTMLKEAKLKKPGIREGVILLAINLALIEQHPSVVLVLLQAIPHSVERDKIISERRIFPQAVASGNFDLTKFVLEEIDDVEERRRMSAESLSLAIDHGHLAVMNLLFATIADPLAIREIIARYDSALFVRAARDGHFAVVREMLNQFPDVAQKQQMIEADNYSSFNSAIRERHFDVALELFQHASAEQRRDMIRVLGMMPLRERGPDDTTDVTVPMHIFNTNFPQFLDSPRDPDYEKTPHSFVHEMMRRTYCGIFELLMSEEGEAVSPSQLELIDATVRKIGLYLYEKRGNILDARNAVIGWGAKRGDSSIPPISKVGIEIDMKFLAEILPPFEEITLQNSAIPGLKKSDLEKANEVVKKLLTAERLTVPSIVENFVSDIKSSVVSKADAQQVVSTTKTRISS